MIQAVIVGGERSGKTTYAKNICSKSGSKVPVFIYNVGSPKDAEGFTEFIIGDDYFSIGSEQFEYKMMGVKIHEFNKCFCYRLDLGLQRVFFENFFKYAGGVQLIMDDAAAIFRHGLPQYLLNILTRKFHVGHKWVITGCDIYIILHNLNQLKNEMLNNSTHIVLFKSNIPMLEKNMKERIDVKEAINHGYKFCREQDSKAKVTGKRSFSHSVIILNKYDKVSITNNKIIV